MGRSKRSRGPVHVSDDDRRRAVLLMTFGDRWVLEYWRTDRLNRFFRTPEEFERHQAAEQARAWRKKRIAQWEEMQGKNRKIRNSSLSGCRRFKK